MLAVLLLMALTAVVPPTTRAIQWASPMQQAAFLYGPQPQCLSGGWGCVEASSRISVVGRGDVAVAELAQEESGPVVLAWTGQAFVPAQATVPAMKGYAALYRVTMCSGRSIIVTDHHKFLTTAGWGSIANGMIAAGRHLAICPNADEISRPREDRQGVVSAEPRLDWKSVELAEPLPRFVSDTATIDSGMDGISASVRPTTRQVQGFQDDCLRAGGYDDARLRWGGAIGPGLSPSPIDAQRHIPTLSRTGDRDSARRRIRSHSRIGHPSTSGSWHPTSYAAGSQECRVDGRTDGLVQVARAGLSASESARNRYAALLPSRLGSDRDTGGVDSASWDCIASVAFVREDVFYDLHVPIWNNYLAHGLIHKNSGKTWLLCLKAIWLATTYPRNRGIIARAVGRELRETTMSTFYRVCPPKLYDRRKGGRRNDQNGQVRFTNGSEILFIHLEDPETQGVIRGLDLSYFVLDQAEEQPDVMEEIFDMLLGRMGRWDVAEVPQWLVDREKAAGREWPFRHAETGKPVPPSYAMIACNPDAETHWIYRRFHPDSHEHQTLYKQRGYKMFEFDSLENRFLADVNKEFLLQHDDAFVRRNVHGRWGIPEGTIHVIDPLSIVPGSPDVLEFIRRTCLLFRVLDHGDSAPTACGWFAINESGDLILFREYYLGNALISTHRRNIADLSAGERYEQDLADPSIFTKLPQKKGGRWSVADEWGDVTEQPRETAVFWQPAENNELGTRNRINERLKIDPEHIHPFTKQRGAPRLYFVQVSDSYPQGCYHAIRETRAQRRVKIGTDLGKAIFSDERDPNVVDHAHDLIRYGVAAHPMAPTIRQVAEPGTFEATRQLLRRERRRLGIRA